jgi:hypothetical protein
MAGPKKPNDNDSNTEAYLFVILAFVAMVCLLIWFKARAVIVLPLLAIDYVFILLLEHTIGIGEKGLQYKQYISYFFDGTYSAWTDISWTVFLQVRSTVGGQVNIVLAAMILGLGAWLMLKMKGKGFNRRFGLADNLQKKKQDRPSFGKYQSEEWKVATYSAQFDPDGRDKDVRPSDRPTDWLKAHNISWENGRFDADNKAKVFDAFKAQLGAPWHGFKRASLHVQALLVLGSLHYLGSMEKYYQKYQSLAVKERELLNIAWAGDNNGEKASQDFVNRHKDTEEVIKVIDHFCKNYGFENTAVFGFMSITKKKSGILKDADMGYVKRFDRSLWYTLNNNGRHAFLIEGAGVVNHWKAEMTHLNALREPRVEEAVLGLERYLNDQGIMSLKQFFTHEEIV